MTVDSPRLRWLRLLRDAAAALEDGGAPACVSPQREEVITAFRNLAREIEAMDDAAFEQWALQASEPAKPKVLHMLHSIIDDLRREGRLHD
jgi:hypothetical protein